MKHSKPKYVELLDNWQQLNERIMRLKEEEIWSLLRHEHETRARHQIMLRLHGRGNKLRAARERRELMIS
jgi:hypothetical protein